MKMRTLGWRRGWMTLLGVLAVGGSVLAQPLRTTPRVIVERGRPTSAGVMADETLGVFVEVPAQAYVTRLGRPDAWSGVLLPPEVRPAPTAVPKPAGTAVMAFELYTESLEVVAFRENLGYDARRPSGHRPRTPELPPVPPMAGETQLQGETADDTDEAAAAVTDDNEDEVDDVTVEENGDTELAEFLAAVEAAESGGGEVTGNDATAEETETRTATKRPLTGPVQRLQVLLPVEKRHGELRLYRFAEGKYHAVGGQRHETSDVAEDVFTAVVPGTGTYVLYDTRPPSNPQAVNPDRIEMPEGVEHNTHPETRALNLEEQLRHHEQRVAEIKAVLGEADDTADVSAGEAGVVPFLNLSVGGGESVVAQVLTVPASAPMGGSEQNTGAGSVPAGGVVTVSTDSLVLVPTPTMPTVPTMPTMVAPSGGGVVSSVSGGNWGGEMGGTLSSNDGGGMQTELSGNTVGTQTGELPVTGEPSLSTAGSGGVNLWWVVLLCGGGLWYGLRRIDDYVG